MGFEFDGLTMHFHIRWSSTELLDWQRFESQADAEVCAAELLRNGETYTIWRFDHTCLRCAPMLRANALRRLN